MRNLVGNLKVSFSTKVLVPVGALMVMLLALTAGVVNRQITRQFQVEAKRALAIADSVFRNSEAIHTRNLLLRFQSLYNEPRYKAAFQSGDLPTVREQLKDLPEEQGIDVVLFTSADLNQHASARRNPLLSLAEFEKRSAPALKQALSGAAQVDTIRVGEKLFDIVCIPVFGNSGEPAGTLTFGSEIGDAAAQEFSLVTHSQIVLLANGHVIASSLRGPEISEACAEVFRQCAAGQGEQKSPRELLLEGEHYFCNAGKFESLSGDAALGYLLLSSYEQPLRALHGTQQMLMLVSAAAILLGTAIVWFLVRTATRPLRELRASAEAVGRGDFSRRVEVTSRDECGELATVFNQMTEDVKRSQQELERTVESLKTTQAQLIQSEKLSGIGEFVAGVAHELNNPLTSVMGFSELLARSETAGPHRRQLELIHKSALRCQKIVQSLLSFARRHAPERKSANVNRLVESAVEFLHYQLRTSNIEVETKFDPSLPETLLDPHQMQQVFLNILNNARQAIEGTGVKGRIQVTTERVSSILRITFQDNGPGISEENLPKLFDPFFTTKELGKGTGLGLSLCYGIVKEHGGTIQVHSRLGAGAIFIIELPLVQSPANLPTAETIPVPEFSTTQGRGKRVLVIDDEEPILEMLKATLTEYGYQVDTAANGEAALQRLQQTSYDLALCDWKMPGLSGRELYERVQKSNPSLSERLIFITGDVVNKSTQQFLKDHNKICLSKPFSLLEFRAALSQACRLN